MMQFANPRRELLGVTQALVPLLRAGGEPPTVMVCGLEGGEGATTVASNLARAIAQEFGGQVCLVRLEGDEAGLPSQPAAAGADVVSAILSRSDVAAALGGGLRRNLPRLADAPLLYLVDGPPLLASLESYRFCGEVDGLVLVAEAERTTGAAIDAARAMVAGARCRLLGAVLNKRRRRVPAFLVSLLGGEFRARPAPAGVITGGATDRLP